MGWLSLIPILVSGIVGMVLDSKGKLKTPDAWLLGGLGMALFFVLMMLLTEE